jgi:hypothetical protein
MARRPLQFSVSGAGFDERQGVEGVGFDGGNVTFAAVHRPADAHRAQSLSSPASASKSEKTNGEKRWLKQEER